jgi:hypothetical protein
VVDKRPHDLDIASGFSFELPATLFFVGLHGLLAVACYLLIVGKIERVVLRPA